MPPILERRIRMASCRDLIKVLKSSNYIENEAGNKVGFQATSVIYVVFMDGAKGSSTHQACTDFSIECSAFHLEIHIPKYIDVSDQVVYSGAINDRCRNKNHLFQRVEPTSLAGGIGY